MLDDHSSLFIVNRIALLMTNESFGQRHHDERQICQFRLFFPLLEFNSCLSASSSVMSISSKYEKWGIALLERTICSAIFLLRPTTLISVSFLEICFGALEELPPVARYASRSDCCTRPPGPVPFNAPRSTPDSLARLLDCGTSKHRATRGDWGFRYGRRRDCGRCLGLSCRRLQFRRYQGPLRRPALLRPLPSRPLLGVEF